ncbi:hypothetical protein SAMN03097699_0737 [Flavobacteriaceae bacterium MAR_2010_188]|nr:hypothetical protein SAMN03097699_0737 [Flavobacteriaceae bacterium MAR_2010_188]
MSMHNFTQFNLIGCCSNRFTRLMPTKPMLGGLKSVSVLMMFMLFFFGTSINETFAQQQSTCDAVPGSFGPQICKAKLYQSNSSAVDDGVINCTTAADTDGCGINISVGAEIKISSRTLFEETTPCYNGEQYVEWIKFYTPEGVNAFKVQGVGNNNFKAFAIFHKEDNVQFIEEFDGVCPGVNEDISTTLLDELTYVGCSSDNQYETFSDPTAVPGELNLYYIAFIYDGLSNGTVNFKVKECEVLPSEICEDLAITCPTDVTVPVCATAAEVMTAFDNFKAGFSFTGGGEIASSNIEDFPAFPADAQCDGKVFTFNYQVTGCDNQVETCSATFTVIGDDEAPVISVENEIIELPCNTIVGDIPTPIFTVTDNCYNGPVTVVKAPSIVEYNSGTPENPCITCELVYTGTVTDACGNEATPVTVTYIWKMDKTDPIVEPIIIDVLCEEVPSIPNTEELIEMIRGKVIENCEGELMITLIDEDTTPNTDDSGYVIEYTFTVVDACGNDTTATIIINVLPIPVLEFNPVADVEINACVYTAQDFTDFLNSFGVTNGTGMFAETYAAPNACGGTVTVVYNATGVCDATGSVSATFTITPAPAVDVDFPSSMQVNACADVQAAFDIFKADFSLDVDSGCAPTAEWVGPSTLSNDILCGGSIELVYRVSDKCFETKDYKATFTITPAPAVVIAPVADYTADACDTQAEVDAQFATFLASFGVSGGCSPDGNFAVDYSAPDACAGGRVEVVYNVTDKCYAGGSETAVFTVPATELPNVTFPESKTVSACDSDIEAQFQAFVNAFTSTGGCDTSVSFETTPVIPNLCGGSVVVNYLVSANCIENKKYTATFTITPAPAVVIAPVADYTADACDTQAEVDAQFATFLASFGVSGGCSPDGNFAVDYTAPDACAGGRVEVVYNVTDKCYDGGSETAVFTVPATELPNVTFPESKTVSACDSDIEAQFEAFVNAFTSTGGCDASVSFETTPVLPNLCGGSVTLNYQVSANCIEDKDYTATFTITPAPAVVIAPVADYTADACDTQAEVDAQFATFLASFGVSGGCSPMGSDLTGYTAPDACNGGRVEVVYNVTDKCYPGGTETGVFTVPATELPNVTFPSSKTVSACDSDIEAQFEAFVNAFTSTGGCDASVSFETTPVLPNLCGGSVTLNYQVRANCIEDKDYTATFTITPAPAVVIAPVADYTADACDTQAEVDAQFATFLASFGVSGGCSPDGNFAADYTAPDACAGGRVEVVYNVTDKCYAGGTETAVFTVPATELPNVTFPSSKTVSACDSDIEAQFEAFVNAFTSTGGCDTSVYFETTPVIPNLCGGSVVVNYQVRANCIEDKDYTATFTITPAPAVVIAMVDDYTADACDTQAEVDAQFATFLTRFSVSGGCSPDGNFAADYSAPDACAGGSVTVVYNVTDKCYDGGSESATFMVPATELPTVTFPESKTVSACDSDIEAQFEAFVNGFTSTGGCDASVSFETTPVLPNLCGGSVVVNYQVRANCIEDKDYRATFTITPAQAVDVVGPADVQASVCDYADQDALTNAYNAFVAAFMVNEDGCGAVGSFEVPPLLVWIFVQIQILH